MKATLPDGTEIEGTPSQIEQFILKSAGRSPSTHYKSSSKGWLKIADMNTNHIRNAILKLYREWLTNAPKMVASAPVTSKNLFVKYILVGCNDITLLAMLKELQARHA